MKPLRPVKKWILTAFGLLLALLMLKIIWLLSARPKVTVDYVAAYNRISRPQNFDPNQNATGDYQKAFDSFVEMPYIRIQYYDSSAGSSIDERTYLEMLYGNRRRPRIQYFDWPSDLDDANQVTFRQWLASNEQAFEYFRAASVKPYYWIEREDKENKGIIGVPMPELGNLRNLADAMTWNAKVKAADGQYRAAFEDILTCYRAGCQQCRPLSFLVEQSVGLTIKERALNAAVTIIDRVEFEPADLKNFQDSLQAEFDKDTYVIDFQTEKLEYFDILQRTFVYNHRGTGRLAWSAVRKHRSMLDSLRSFKWMGRQFLGCLVGPTSNEMTGRIDEMFASFESVKTWTPWKLHSWDADYFEKLNITHCDNCYDFGLNMVFRSVSFPWAYQRFYRLKARKEALLTILAVHRFRAELGTLPAALEDLVSSGYLRRMPPDPFSDGPLVYRVDENEFTLYSVGDDFKDDGGKTSGGIAPGTYPRAASPDIVFWPPARPRPSEKPPEVRPDK